MIKSIIVAKAVNHVIGNKGRLPWHMPADLKHFKELTGGHHVIMGRKTFESLPGPLPGRKIIILSQSLNYKVEDCTVVPSLEMALKIANQANETEVFIAGGAAVYREALGIVDKIYLTVIHTDVEGDTFFPILEDHQWTEVSIVSHNPDIKHVYAYDFIELARRI
ncbi:MAG: dihydrofolate reductase [Candidatus Amoebophilus sp.]